MYIYIYRDIDIYIYIYMYLDADLATPPEDSLGATPMILAVQHQQHAVAL